MKIDITLPTGLNEIPLLRYQKFIEMKEKSNDEEFIAQKTIQIFCGIELKEVMQIRLKDLNELIKHFTDIFSKRPGLIKHFKIGEHSFGFIPNLENISFGEYIDIEQNMQKWDTYHKAMAVMYRPIKEQYKDKYSIEDYEPNVDMQELMKFAPLDVALSASFFLSNLGIELLKATTSFLRKEMKMIMDSASTQKELNSPKTGDGIVQSINVLEEMLPDLMRLQNSDLLNVSPISRSRKKKQKLKIEN